MLLTGVRLGLIGLLLTASPARHVSPTTWVIAPAESEVLFDFQRNGETGSGRFTRFAGEGNFDPAHPEMATLEMRVESASIDVDDKVVSNFATTEEYFDSETYPHVVYRLLKLTPKAGGQYFAEGELTIRRFTRPVSALVTLQVSGDDAHAIGRLQIRRKDFHFGVGPTSVFVDLGPEIAVRFDLTAHPS